MLTGKRAPSLNTSLSVPDEIPSMANASGAIALAGGNRIVRCMLQRPPPGDWETSKSRRALTSWDETEIPISQDG
jgi:hypothetical protein